MYAKYIYPATFSCRIAQPCKMYVHQNQIRCGSAQGRCQDMLHSLPERSADAVKECRVTVDDSKVRAFTDAHWDRHLEDVRAFVRQPSISADGTGMEECAQ